jgi:hypothetical protein
MPDKRLDNDFELKKLIGYIIFLGKSSVSGMIVVGQVCISQLSLMNQLGKQHFLTKTPEILKDQHVSHMHDRLHL